MDKKEWLILAEKVIKRTRSYRDNRERGIPDSENFQVYTMDFCKQRSSDNL